MSRVGVAGSEVAADPAAIRPLLAVVSAVGVAALLGGHVPDIEGRRVVVVLSGGNIDLPLLQAVVRRGLTVSGRYLVMRTRIRDRRLSDAVRPVAALPPARALYRRLNRR